MNKHTECPKCGSSDACYQYDDGEYCFSCQQKVFTKVLEGGGKEVVSVYQDRKTKVLPVDTIMSLSSRKLFKETCEKYKYFTTTYKDKTGKLVPVQVAPYYNMHNEIVAQKVRYPNKDFTVLGDLSSAGLFGQQLFASGGKRLVITEGEIDCLSVSQVLNNTWPVVSVPNGAAGATKAVKNQLMWVESFDEVVIMFDQDEPGQKAALEVASLLSPGKAKIAHLLMKDPNEMLVNGKAKELVGCVFQAKEFRPEGLINGSELWDLISSPPKMGVAYPWEGLNSKLYGLRPNEIVMLCAGSGTGKSAVCAEIAYHLAVTNNHSVGYIALEEGIQRTGRRVIGIDVNKPIHLPNVEITNVELLQSFERTLDRGTLWFDKAFGSKTGELMSKLRYLVKGKDCKWIILDHISLVISAQDVDTDERRMIDKMITDLRCFTEETGCGMIIVSHLKRPAYKGHEDGASTSLSQLRGSHALAHLSDAVIGLERNQQASTPDKRNTTRLRVLKNRYAGETGVASYLEYSHETGRLMELAESVGESRFEEEDRKADSPFNSDF